ncbi:CARDB domain-containing protein [Paenibacillus macquariensis]|uniref:Conserved repeat domain-containing protein n=1 Tax=Paenibacillus macquariensis TaxID=948756 RepID=A0ABY1JP81_9BACL|nr:CARDB domain-containing protein [Paenibacillus macquariensis]MEC0092001.1 CARDB domain-containing protein [Paenibacillus macquariensis]OAB37428.1 hypothetical protein PMSM_05020 [Paenibacillus macquariensis subsp. macquariensis]SIQ52952.1 conserved repeat domain-containing protein [Paenibacillus macquariensis]
MTSGSRPYPVVSNQSMVHFSSAAGVDSIAYSNIVDTPVVGPVLSLIKSADKVRASLGETIVYTIIADNTGNTAAELTVYDTLPEGVSFILNSVLRNGILLPGVNPVSGIPAGTLTPESQVIISFQVIVVSLPPDLTLLNKALCKFTFVTPEGRVITDELYSNTVTISLIAFQICTSLAANTSTTFVGDVVTYTLQIINEGIQSLQDVIAVIPVPEGAVFITGSVIVSGIYYPESDPNIGINLGTLSAGTNIEISFRVSIVEVPPTSTLINTATVSYVVDGNEYNTESNTVVVVVVSPDVTISKIVDLSIAAPGDSLSYELTVRNNGNIAVDAILIDVIPSGTLFVWDSVLVNGVVMKGVLPDSGITLSTLSPGTVTVVQFKVTIAMAINIYEISEIQNQGSLQYTFLLPDGRTVRQLSRSNVVTTYIFTPLISLEICVDPTCIELGGRVKFKLLLSNTGNWPAEVSLIQLYPEGTTLDSNTITIDGISSPQNPFNGTIPLNTVNAGITVRITYIITVNEYLLSHFLKGFSSAIYQFILDERTYVGKVQSNSYTITVEEFSE